MVGVRSPALSAKASVHEITALKLKPRIGVRGQAMATTTDPRKERELCRTR
jgi:hypothetical protein